VVRIRRIFLPAYAGAAIINRYRWLQTRGRLQPAQVYLERGRLRGGQLGASTVIQILNQVEPNTVSTGYDGSWGSWRLHYHANRCPADESSLLQRILPVYTMLFIRFTRIVLPGKSRHLRDRCLPRLSVRHGLLKVFVW